MSVYQTAPDNNDSHPITVSLSSDEIFALKELAAKQKKGFWRDYALLISLCAFLLSFITAIISLYLGHKRDVHDQLGELTTAIRSLEELNIKQMELTEKYAGTPNEGRAISLISNQVYNATIMAADIAFRVGTNATTASIIPISQNLYHYGQYSRAEALARIGQDAARTYEDEIMALRWLGIMKIQSRNTEEMAQGNQLFLSAFNFEQRYGAIRSTDTASYLKAGTQLEWADTLAPIDCDQARQHFSDAWRILNAAGTNIDLDRTRRLARAKLNTGIGGLASCKVDQNTLPNK